MEDENDILEIDKSNKAKWIILIIFILLIIGGISFYYFMYFNNPIYVMEKGLEKYSLFYKDDGSLDENKTLRLRGGLEFDLKGNTEEQKVYDIINNISLLYTLEGDLEKDLYNFKISSKYEDEDLINGRIFINKNNAYLYLEDIFNKYIKVVLDEEKQEEDSISEDEMEDLINDLVNAFLNEFKKEDFKREKETIKYNDKEISVYKNYIEFNEDNREKITSSVITTLKANNKFNEVLKETFGKEEASKLYDVIEELGNILKGEFIVYTKGITNKFVKILVKFEYEDNWFKFEDDGVNGMKLTYFVDGELTETITELNGLYNYKVTINSKDKNNIKSTMIITMIVENIEKIEEVHEEKAVSLEKLTEDDLIEIMENITNNKGINKLLEAFGNLINVEDYFTYSM